MHSSKINSDEAGKRFAVERFVSEGVRYLETMAREEPRGAFEIS